MQGRSTSNSEEIKDDEISVKQLFNNIGKETAYLKSQWLVIIVVGILCAAIGLAYAFYKKPVYTAATSFVLEDGDKSSGLGQYSGLAALAGINIGGDGGGIFHGDNILELYKSRLMLEKTLLSKVNIEGREQLLIDRYIDANKLRQKWDESAQTKDITFNGDPAKFNRAQDSIITDLVTLINKKILSVTKPDKKLSIIMVVTATNDELFSKEFNIKLVETVNNFYTQTKTKKSLQNVLVLQKQVDSIKNVLNNSISGVASANDAAPNANPAMSSLRVPSQRRQVDVQASGAIYGEIVKNLEISKVSLRQETPLIQVIDQPVLPLYETKLGKVKALVIGFILGIVMASVGLFLRNTAKRLMA